MPKAPPTMVHIKVPGDVWAQLRVSAGRRSITIQSALREAVEQVVVSSRRFREWMRIERTTVEVTVYLPDRVPSRVATRRSTLPERRGVEVPRGLWRAFKAEAMATRRSTAQLLVEAADAYTVRTDRLLAFCALADTWPEADAQHRGPRRTARA